jgi:5-methylcytosine-specific restriction endonuclease McrA
VRYKLCRCGGVREDRSGGKCSKCGAGVKRNARTTNDNGYGWDWQQLSMRYRKDHPLCAECAKTGRAVAAEEVHHIVPIDEAPWLRLSVSNLMALCVPCHRRMDQERRTVGD